MAVHWAGHLEASLAAWLVADWVGSRVEWMAMHLAECSAGHLVADWVGS